jgi:hypothetical protein
MEMIITKNLKPLLQSTFEQLPLLLLQRLLKQFDKHRMPNIVEGMARGRLYLLQDQR